jgi:hypothetical protein
MHSIIKGTFKPHKYSSLQQYIKSQVSTQVRTQVSTQVERFHTQICREVEEERMKHNEELEMLKSLYQEKMRKLRMDSKFEEVKQSIRTSTLSKPSILKATAKNSKKREARNYSSFRKSKVSFAESEMSPNVSLDTSDIARIRSSIPYAINNRITPKVKRTLAHSPSPYSRMKRVKTSKNLTKLFDRLSSPTPKLYGQWTKEMISSTHLSPPLNSKFEPFFKKSPQISKSKGSSVLKKRKRQNFMDRLNKHFSENKAVLPFGNRSLL